MYIKNEYYSILNSKRTDTLSVIKRNYKNLCLKHHPDVGGDEEYFKKINLAMDIIDEFHEENIYSDNFKSTDSKNNSKKKSNTNKSNKKSTNSNKEKNKTKNKQNKQNNGYKNSSKKCSNCGSQYDENDVFCDQCGRKIHRKKDKSNNNEDIELLCIGVVLITIGLFLLSICWPFGIIYFYILYKYIFS